MRCNPVCPKNVWQLFHPFSLYVVQPLFKSAHYDLIDSLSLSIPLWICWGGISIRYAQVTTISPKGLAIELKTVVRDEGTRDSKPSDNIFSNKSLGIHIPDICQQFNFNPFGEVICADQQIPLIPYCLREMTYNVQATLSKRPKAGQRIKNQGSQFRTVPVGTAGIYRFGQCTGTDNLLISYRKKY